MGIFAAASRKAVRKTRVDGSGWLPRTVAAYTARVELDGGGVMLYLSGQVADGATLADVINVRTYLTDIGRLHEYGAVRREFLTGTAPTSMTFEVSRLFRPEALVEVEVVAAVSPR
ncbi:RidA family protein [Streptomyces phaeochromogenes]